MNKLINHEERLSKLEMVVAKMISPDPNLVTDPAKPHRPLDFIDRATEEALKPMDLSELRKQLVLLGHEDLMKVVYDVMLANVRAEYEAPEC